MAEITVEELQANPQKTSDARLQVQIAPDQPLPIGSHTFELVVVDNAGNASRPARVTVIVQDTTAPTAVLTVLDARGRPLPVNANNVPVVEFGTSFILNGEQSLDAPPGQIASFTWRMLA